MSPIQEFTELPESEEDYRPPSYRDKADLMIEITHVSCERRPIYRYDVEWIDDTGGCTFWINEGVGIEFWADTYLHLELPGFYVIEGIIGDYTRGDGWTTDDDEEWDFDLCRRATPEEIAARSIIMKPKVTRL